MCLRDSLPDPPVDPDLLRAVQHKANLMPAFLPHLDDPYHTAYSSTTMSILLLAPEEVYFCLLYTSRCV